ncbi:MAG TPA: DNA-protecting protein DprA [Erysipelotrichaceae bacterium]|nr:DNA-protecting protein DprA [Erysipelotrichaceae bacterium]
MSKFCNDSRKLLIYLAVKYDGDFTKILTALQLKEDIDTPYEVVEEVYQSLKCKTITFLDYDYPERLKKIYRPPLVLFYYGDISLLSDDKKTYGVVGSRKYSEYGKAVTEKIVSEMPKDSILVSGLARGIDCLAHKEALNNHTRTIAVLGSGIDNCYPSENANLYETIKKEHLLISEYPNAIEPNPANFPQRNRIIVGLSQALIVPQVNSFQSGTMVSINLALSISRPIFVAPCSIFEDTVNNDLISEGAEVLKNAQQIVENLKWN